MRLRLPCQRYFDEAPLEASVPLAPPEVPELEPPLGALELALSEDELPGAELESAPLAPYCFTQSSRSVPLMPTHWLGIRSLLAPLEPLVEVP